MPTVDTVSLMRVVRKHFELGLHKSKVLAESLQAGADAGEIYDRYIAGVQHAR